VRLRGIEVRGASTSGFDLKEGKIHLDDLICKGTGGIGFSVRHAELLEYSKLESINASTANRLHRAFSIEHSARRRWGAARIRRSGPGYGVQGAYQRQTRGESAHNLSSHRQRQVRGGEPLWAQSESCSGARRATLQRRSEALMRMRGDLCEKRPACHTEKRKYVVSSVGGRDAKR
jgi:hypothetical protein